MLHLMKYNEISHIIGEFLNKNINSIYSYANFGKKWNLSLKSGQMEEFKTNQTWVVEFADFNNEPDLPQYREKLLFSSNTCRPSGAKRNPSIFTKAEYDEEWAKHLNKAVSALTIENAATRAGEFQQNCAQQVERIVKQWPDGLQQAFENMNKKSKVQPLNPNVLLILDRFERKES